MAMPNEITQSESTNESRLGLNRSDRIFLVVCCAAALLLLLGRSLSVNLSENSTIDVVRPNASQVYYQLEINQATWVEWTLLEGIGETTARNIVADREAKGAFASIDELQRVRGIGPKTLEKMRPLLRCESCD